ncbi:hypothetical protein RI367_003326 [Sorochytrium milnesiophthora]
MTTQVLVTGASGLLGRAVFKRFQQERHYQGTAWSRASNVLVKIDLTDATQLRQLFERKRPKVVIHCAAERRPDVAENDHSSTYKLNVDTSRLLASLAKEYGALLIYISTDYIFDGTKPPYETTDAPNPLSFYGKSKLGGEQAVLEANPQAVVLRVPVLYGEAQTPAESAVNVLLDVVQSGKPVRMDNYATRFPTNVADVANVLAQLAKLMLDGDKRVSGVLHFSAPQAMTKYDMCVIIGKVYSAHIDHITPDNEEPKGAVTRPKNAQLSTKRLQELGVDLSCVDFEEWWNTQTAK